MKSEKDIIKITKIDRVKIKNTHNETVFPEQSILKVEFRGGDCRILDLFSSYDITEIDYFEVINTPKTKEKILYKEFEG